MIQLLLLLYGESGDSNTYSFIDILFKTNCLDQLAINESILLIFEPNVEETAFNAYYLYLSKNETRILTLNATIMKINKNELPIIMETPDLILRNIGGQGGMAIAFNELPKGTDFTPLLKGLDNDCCHCAHWGYLIEGEIRIIYNDKSEELTKAGDVFYWPAGHTGIVEKDAKFIEFSPQKEFKEVMDHIGKKMAELG